MIRDISFAAGITSLFTINAKYGTVDSCDINCFFLNKVVGNNNKTCFKTFHLCSTACEVGYFTEEEGREKCKPCFPKKYGKKCAFSCICNENESCDNENGTCIPWTTTFGTFSEYWNYTRNQTQPTEESDSKNGANTKGDKDTTKYGILIYMVCAGFIILVLCAVAVAYKYQKNVKKLPKDNIKYGERGSDIPPIPPRSMHHNDFIDLHDNGSVYELIDDENLLNL